jgi:predicted transcriptional regulator of viral defense system
MNYISFQLALASQILFSTQDIYRHYPQFDSRRLVEWQQKGYIRRVVNRWYVFAHVPINERLLWWTANQIYQPSYLSLETALSYHGIIPEGVYVFTSVSSRKTQHLQTGLGTFSYRQIKSAYFFGYEVLRLSLSAVPDDRPVRMAYPEKALLDYCYLNPNLTTEADFEALRLNVPQLRQQLDVGRLDTYLSLFNNRQLTARIRILQTYLARYA